MSATDYSVYSQIKNSVIQIYVTIQAARVRFDTDRPLIPYPFKFQCSLLCPSIVRSSVGLFPKVLKIFVSASAVLTTAAAQEGPVYSLRILPC
jgi:hypothetical protein